jgi:hypothetical protein
MHGYDEDKADIITSLCEDGLHAPVFNVLVPISLHVDSMFGTGNVRIEKKITLEQYIKILEALCEAGIVSPNTLKQLRTSGYTVTHNPGSVAPTASFNVADIVRRDAQLLDDNKRLVSENAEIQAQFSDLRSRTKKAEDEVEVLKNTYTY